MVEFGAERRMATVDAQTYWLSAKVPSDIFLLCGFAGQPEDLQRCLDTVRRHAAGDAELRLRVRDGSALTYPRWIVGEVGDDQVVVHRRADTGWLATLDVICGLAADQLDARQMTWRMHVFTPVHGMPGVDGPGTVAVVQAAHVVGDGIRLSAMAATLLGRRAAVAAVASPAVLRSAALPWRAFRAARANRRLVRDVGAGFVAPQADTRPALQTNQRPAGMRANRIIVRNRAALSGPTVTIAVLGAVSDALAGHLRELGDDPAQLGAEVPMARGGTREAHNQFGNVGVGLYPGLAAGERMARIDEDLAARRRRSEHPAMVASRRASGAMPAPLLRWGVDRFDPDVRSPTVIGNTVVSSVNCGLADLSFGDLPVVMAALFPALSPMMGLTHGVFGVGDTVAISVHAAASAIADIDAYVSRLDAALGAHQR